MEINITSGCTRCGKCVRICPAAVFSTSLQSSHVEVTSDMCIACGHCVAVCPEHAIVHEQFPPEKVHPLNRTQYPAAEQMLTLIRGRRSNRAFSKKEVPDEMLAQIVEAAYRAPTASNLQQVAFTLITDPEKLQAIATFTLNTFGAMIKKVDHFIGRAICKRWAPGIYKYMNAFKRMKREYSEGNDRILRGATAVLLIHAPAKSRFGCEDSNLAYQNGSLMAEALQVNQFYLGFVLSASKQRKGKLEEMLGIEGRIYAGMALGMPAFQHHSYIDKEDISIQKL